MSTKDFTANVISASKVVPDGNFKDSKASGIWDINEALDLIKGGNWPNVANINPAAFVDALFQTHLYDGNSSTQAINNGIDLTKGGLVWIKRRDGNLNHALFDTARGAGAYIAANIAAGHYTGGDDLTAFNSNGFTLGDGQFTSINYSSYNYASWTFRKQPKFFDVVKYEGTGSARTVAHSLGTTVGMIIVKNLDQSDNWAVYHRGADASAPEDKYLILNLTSAAADDSAWWNDTAPTSSVFTVGTDHSVNASGENYIAYLFAHNNDDGGFGEPGDQDIIKCGSYTGNNSTTGPVIDLGFEPQWIFIKHIDSGAGGGDSSFIFDNMRGVVTGGNDISLSPDAANDEQTSADSLEFNASGFQLKRANSSVNGNGNNYIYVAIRRGNMQTPTAASDVFAIDARTGSTPEYISGFPVDFALIKDSNSSSDWIVNTRLLGNTFLETNTTAAEDSDSLAKFDIQNGIRSDAVAGDYGWMWKRARGYFDVVTYTGTGSNRTVAHNLGVAPEMMWVKNRDTTNDDWFVYVSGITHLSTYGSDPDSYGSNPAALTLNSTDTANFSMSGVWNHTHPTSTVFSTGDTGATNGNGEALVAFLFASVTGVSKIGSYTGNGSSQTIDCGFTSGSKFVLIKRVNDTGHWQIWDTERGLVDGNDTRLILNGTGANLTGYDMIDPDNSGFAVTNANDTNENNKVYIFYAIAA